MPTRMRCRGIFGRGNRYFKVPGGPGVTRLRFDLLKLVTMREKNTEIRVAVVSSRTVVVSLAGI